MDNHEQIERNGFNLSEASKYLGISTTSLRRMIRRGEVPAARLGGPQKGRIIILKDDLDQFLDQQKRAFEESRVLHKRE